MKIANDMLTLLYIKQGKGKNKIFRNQDFIQIIFKIHKPRNLLGS